MSKRTTYTTHTDNIHFHVVAAAAVLMIVSFPMLLPREQRETSSYPQLVLKIARPKTLVMKKLHLGAFEIETHSYGKSINRSSQLWLEPSKNGTTETNSKTRNIDIHLMEFPDSTENFRNAKRKRKMRGKQVPLTDINEVEVLNETCH